MKAVIQRVSQASVALADNPTKAISSIGKGYVILLGIHIKDTNSDIAELLPKILNIKLFSELLEDRGEMEGKCSQKSRWKRSIMEEEGGIIFVSQFTLYAVAGKSKICCFLTIKRRSSTRFSSCHECKSCKDPIWEFCG